jgi:Sodium:sulfate symporter transmembrane region
MWGQEDFYQNNLWNQWILKKKKKLKIVAEGKCQIVWSCWLIDYFIFWQSGKAAYILLVSSIFMLLEIVPLSATVLLTIFLIPLTGVQTLQEASKSFVNVSFWTGTSNKNPQMVSLVSVLPDFETSALFQDSYFLFMGIIILAVSIEDVNLHKRMALLTLKAIGVSPSRYADKAILEDLVKTFAFLIICQTDFRICPDKRTAFNVDGKYRYVSSAVCKKAQFSSNSKYSLWSSGLTLIYWDCLGSQKVFRQSSFAQGTKSFSPTKVYQLERLKYCNVPISRPNFETHQWN